MRHGLFSSQSAYDIFQTYLKDIKTELESKSNDYILNVDVNTWREYIINKYDFIPLTVYTDKATDTYKGKGQRQEDSRYGETFTIDEYRFEVSVPFTGWSYLFCLRPSSFLMDSLSVETPNGDSGLISYTFNLTQQDENKFKREKDRFLHLLNTNTININKDLVAFKQAVPNLFNSHYEHLRNKVIAEANFFERLNININTNTDKIYKVPVIEKRTIPEPLVDRKMKTFSTDVPTLDDKVYDDILEIIYTFFKSVEKKPSTYSVLDEEGLRDYVLPVLETRYNNTTVTGETFNKGGRTDILMRYKDGTNLFIAECKFWKGEASIDETVNQLFERYLTWRDSKVAIIFFVNNKEFSKVLNVLKVATPKHPYFLREQGIRGESSFSYIFHFPTDNAKYVYVEVMAFHFPI